MLLILVLKSIITVDNHQEPILFQGPFLIGRGKSIRLSWKLRNILQVSQHPAIGFRAMSILRSRYKHLTVAFLKERGYESYFPHGIGHFLGIDVHDVGDRSEPLKEGDVITIEPGIYIPQERLGVRIEDNYWITAKGAVCMSDELPRDSYEIEEMMKGELDEGIKTWQT